MAMTSKVRSKTLQKFTFAESEFHKIANTIRELDIDHRSLKKIQSIQFLMEKRVHNRKRVLSFTTFAIIIMVFAIIVFNGIHTKDGFVRFWFWWKGIYHTEDRICAITMPSSLQNAFMPSFDCSICTHLENVTKVANLTREEFSQRYAYSGIPVVVTDAMNNWTAPEIFSFEFFKEIYPKDSPALRNYEPECQFFPYKTQFKSLSEVFNMSEERAKLTDGSEPWYIGWSNCDPMVANILRKHYERPYFLPSDSEGTRMDWIFMGSPGYGAQMHIDHVSNPSWQSQIRGTKLWILEPPPECYTTCNTLKVIVESGEIIILDTNQWYHKTIIVGEDISITIGSEYD